jgi:hypothetical protein
MTDPPSYRAFLRAEIVLYVFYARQVRCADFSTLYETETKRTNQTDASYYLCKKTNKFGTCYRMHEP